MIERIAFTFLLALVLVLVSALVNTMLERRLMAFMQSRLGPNRHGPWGMAQPLADALKLLGKEAVIPRGVERLPYLAAPILAFLPSVLVLIATPLSSRFQIEDINLGLVYVVAVGSLTVFGVLLAGASSDNKYSLIGGMRAAAQMLSYEVPMLLSLAVVGLLAGSLSLSAVVRAQNIPFAFIQPLAFFVYLAAATSEMNRTPFDFNEAESELTTGYITEYSGMRFAFFYLAEYAGLTVNSILIATLFLGGPRGPFEAGPLWLALKVLFLTFIFIWVRSTLPRIQVHKLTSFSWKLLVPVSLLNVVYTASVVTLSSAPRLLAIAPASLLALVALGVAFSRRGRSLTAMRRAVQ